MNLTNAISGRPALAAAVAVILVLAGGAVQATPTAPEAPATSLASASTPAATVVLEYKMPAGRALTYQSKSEEAQVMEVQGQSMDTQTTNTGTFTFKAKGLKDKNFLLGVTIDDIVTTMTSNAQGDMSPNMGAVKGKSFDMVLSPLGSEVDVSGAEAITYDLAGDSHNLSSGFKMFFPDMPGKPVKVGDTWPSSAGTEDKSSSMNIRIDFQYVNTLEGLETVEGMECARISSQVTGTITGTGNQMGTDLTFSGTSKGKDVWYFAVKEGIFVRTMSESTTEMSIDVPAAGATIPMTQTTKAEVKLAGKK
ncbi:MAG: hypothetical protein IH583_05635 [Candidatus Aminicenantes bacterium]|nr:hypothetical protein [Candidatus Aminicenantes bacterium]TFG53695.1 MAG: hypothetical protein E4H35_08145 [Candidatus Aminicenantes bacterium]